MCNVPGRRVQDAALMNRKKIAHWQRGLRRGPVFGLNAGANGSHDNWRPDLWSRQTMSIAGEGAKSGDKRCACENWFLRFERSGSLVFVAAATPRLLMAAKPIMDNWMLHHSEAGVRCVGAIRNHQKFPDGSFVRTSVVVARFPGGIVTENGSSYMLGNKHPQNGAQSQGLYLSLAQRDERAAGKSMSPTDRAACDRNRNSNSRTGGFRRT